MLAMKLGLAKQQSLAFYSKMPHLKLEQYCVRNDICWFRKIRPCFCSFQKSPELKKQPIIIILCMWIDTHTYMNVSLHLTSVGFSVALSGLCRRRHPSLASLWTISNRLISSLSHVTVPGPCCSAGDTENTYLRPQSHAMRLQHTRTGSSQSHWEFDSPSRCIYSGETESPWLWGSWDDHASPEGLVSSRRVWPVRRKASKSEALEIVLLEGESEPDFSLSFGSLYLSLSLALTHIARVGATRKHLAVPPILNRKHCNLQKMGERPA